MENEIKEFYNKSAKKTADAWYENEILVPTIQEFLELLPRNPRVIDLGCGPGHESKRLKKYGAEVLGIDFSEENIKLAEELSSGCDFKILDFLEINESLGKFDGIFACASLIHISHENFEKVIENLKKVLVKNGFLLMIIQDGIGIKEEWSLMEIDGKKYKRPVYLYNKDLVLEKSEKFKFKFFKEGLLNNKLKESGWKNYILKLENY